MSQIRVILKWEQLPSADRNALPALQGLCRALGLQTHWDEGESTLYIASPMTGRTLALLGASAAERSCELAAAGITGLLHNRLEGAGAQVIGLDEGEAALTLGIAVGLVPDWGVGAFCRQPELKALLTNELTKATRLPALEGCIAQGIAEADLTVLIGRPSEPDQLTLTNPAWQDTVSDAIYRALARFWASTSEGEAQSDEAEELPEESGGGPLTGRPFYFSKDLFIPVDLREPEEEPATPEEPVAQYEEAIVQPMPQEDALAEPQIPDEEELAPAPPGNTVSTSEPPRPFVLVSAINAARLSRPQPRLSPRSVPGNSPVYVFQHARTEPPDPDLEPVAKAEEAAPSEALLPPLEVLEPATSMTEVAPVDSETAADLSASLKGAAPPAPAPPQPPPRSRRVRVIQHDSVIRQL